MKRNYFIASVAGIALASVGVIVAAQSQGTPPDGPTTPVQSEQAPPPDDANATSPEVSTPASDPAREEYLKALDSLSDEQAQMVPVVLATIGEIVCDGLVVDRAKSSAFIAAHAADDTEQARKDEADVAKTTSDALLTPWLTYVQQDSGPFCEQAYALKQSGRDLWKQ